VRGTFIGLQPVIQGIVFCSAHHKLPLERHEISQTMLINRIPSTCNSSNPMIFPYVEFPSQALTYTKARSTLVGCKEAHSYLSHRTEARTGRKYTNSSASTTPKDTLQESFGGPHGKGPLTNPAPRGFPPASPKSGGALVQLDRKILGQPLRVTKQAPLATSADLVTTGSPSEIDRQKRLQKRKLGFIEIDPGQLRTLLSPHPQRAPELSPRSKTIRRPVRVLPFPLRKPARKEPRKK